MHERSRRTQLSAQSSPTPQFISTEQNEGDPLLHWENFKCPQLRKLPKSPNSLGWLRLLGGGQDGFVLSAQTPEEVLLAVKFVGSVPRAIHLILTQSVLP